VQVKPKLQLPLTESVCASKLAPSLDSTGDWMQRRQEPKSSPISFISTLFVIFAFQFIPIDLAYATEPAASPPQSSAGTEKKAQAQPDNLGFTAQCPKLLAMVDDFGHECLEKARQKIRTFYPSGGDVGVEETQSAYFRAGTPGSHFGLGCTLNAQHKISFLGVYYSTNGDNFKVANTSPIRYIDFNGVVGIMVNDKPVNLLLVRQFGSDFVPLHFPQKTIKNCEVSKQSTGETADENGRFWAFEEKRPGGLSIKSCVGPKENWSCWTHDYIEFFPSPQRQIIYHGDAFSPVFIRDGGDLIVQKDYLEQACAAPKERRKTDAEFILFELCPR
jgi:hypothetical protein